MDDVLAVHPRVISDPAIRSQLPDKLGTAEWSFSFLSHDFAARHSPHQISHFDCVVKQLVFADGNKQLFVPVVNSATLCDWLLCPLIPVSEEDKTKRNKWKAVCRCVCATHIKSASKCLGAQQISLIFYSYLSTLSECAGTSCCSEAINFRRISPSGVILYVIMCNFHTGDMCGLFLFMTVFAGLFLPNLFINTDLTCRFGIRQFIECRWPVKCDGVDQATVTTVARRVSNWAETADPQRGARQKRENQGGGKWNTLRQGALLQTKNSRKEVRTFMRRWREDRK